MQRFFQLIKSKPELIYFFSVFVLLTFSYFKFGTYRNWPYKIESDGKYYYQFLVSGYYDHDFDFSNNYNVEAYSWMHNPIDHYDYKDIINQITNRPTNVFTIGPAILWTPFFLFSKFLGWFLNLFNSQIDTGPWSKFTQYSVMYAAVVYCVLTLILLYKLLNQFFNKKTSISSTWLILVATNLYYYSVFEVSMSHVYDLFTFVLYLYFFSKCINNRSKLYFFGLALSGALNVLVRTQNIITIGLFSISLIFIIAKLQKQSFPFQLFEIYFLVLFIGIFPILLVNNYLYGNPFTIPQGNGFLNLRHPEFFKVLLSQRNGLFSHHPILLFGLLGFIIFFTKVCKGKRFDQIVFFLTMIIAFIFQVYINGAVSDWWAGHSFGQRRLISSFPLFVYGFAFLLEKVSKHKSAINGMLIFIFTIAGFYLTYIHVELWDYNLPHNIFLWMFYLAPKEILQKGILLN
jgi:hypothetical protein